jgi:hypothetical protein
MPRGSILWRFRPRQPHRGPVPGPNVSALPRAPRPVLLSLPRVPAFVGWTIITNPLVKINAQAPYRARPWVQTSSPPNLPAPRGVGYVLLGPRRQAIVTPPFVPRPIVVWVRVLPTVPGQGLRTRLPRAAVTAQTGQARVFNLAAAVGTNFNLSAAVSTSFNLSAEASNTFNLGATV